MGVAVGSQGVAGLEMAGQTSCGMFIGNLKPVIQMFMGWSLP